MEGETMKNVLVPLDQNPITPSVLATALLLARRFASRVEGLGLRPVFTEIVAPDPIVAVTLPPSDWDEAEFAKQARATFDAFAASAADAPDVTFEWRDGRAVDDVFLGTYARLFDVTVLGRPSSRGPGSRMSTFESVLFDSGRPLLLAPPTPPASLGERILVHWNQSAETALVTALAMPLLKQAKAVSIITVEGANVDGPPAEEFQRVMRFHGIEADVNRVEGKGQRAGELILERAAAVNADLLIKGAYTNSRVRQMIFGGATQHILATAELPVFMSH
jgi:nucleotide-binding universal stress UspA family protein